MNQIITCADQRDLEARRNTLKRAAKKDGVFLKCEGNVLHVKSGKTFTFEIAPQDVTTDGHLPHGALRAAVQEMME